MAQKAKIEIQDTDKQGNQVEIAKSVPIDKAKAYVKSSGPQAARSVFAKGRGRRPRAIAGKGMNGQGRGRGKQAMVQSCFAGGPQDGSGPLGGTAECQLSQG